jgi:Zn-dependent M28 family amino/carboxypeptidase
MRNPFVRTAFACLLLLAAPLLAQPHFRGDRAYDLAREFVAIGPRWCTGPGHVKAEAFLRDQLKHDALEEDAFTANTPIGAIPMRNFIVRFPGKKDGVIVLITHYETNYPLRNTGFVGANDGASTTGMLLEIANELRPQVAGGKKLDGYSVWIAFLDGEEAIEQWQGVDHTYGSRHLAAKWGQDGTLNKIKALLLADMLGDKELNVLRESQSTPWLADMVAQAAKLTGNSRYFFQTQGAEEDDHMPFLQRGVPSIDIIDVDYGPHTQALPDGYHHTPQDTLDKISPKSLTIAGNVFLETIDLIDRNR